MAISLTGMASGLDTESIISQLMAIEQNKVTAVQKRQVSVTQHKTDLQHDQDQARRGQDGGRPTSAVGVAVEGRSRPRRPRTRRRSTPPCSAAPASAATRSRSTASPPRRSTASTTRPAPTRASYLRLHQRAAPTVVDRHRGQRHRRRHRRGHQRRTTSAPVYAAVVKDGGVEQARLLLAQDRRRTRTSPSTRRSSAPAASSARTPPTARTGATLNASIKVDGGAEHEPRVQRPRDDHPGRAPDAEGHHGEPGLGEHDLSRPSTATRSRRRSRRSSTPTTPSSPPRARS